MQILEGLKGKATRLFKEPHAIQRNSYSFHSLAPNLREVRTTPEQTSSNSFLLFALYLILFAPIFLASEMPGLNHIYPAKVDRYGIDDIHGISPLLEEV